MKLDSRAARLALVVGLGLASSCGPTQEPPPPAPECAEGALGCRCSAGDRCGTTKSGERLLCEGGICEAMNCLSGERGCACRGGAECNDPADGCSAGFCMPTGCAPGESDCRCLADSCDLGLVCLDGAICADSQGYEGGRCLDNGRCHRGNRCDMGTGLCVFCSPGTAGCSCNVQGACNAGLACSAGVCLSSAQLPPANPVCYTPCRSDLVHPDGGVNACSASHVLPGCIDDLQCVQGSCIPPGAAKPSCAGDLDCPFFQVCLTGGCYSNCEVNADCASGMGCYRHACRSSCLVSKTQGACPPGYACTADDGEFGFCMAVGSVSSSASALASGGLEVPVKRVELSNVQPDGTFMVVPSASTTQEVTIRKLWHQATFADGNVQRVDAPLDSAGAYRTCDAAKGECPLSWVGLKVPGGAVQRGPTVTFQLTPACVNTLAQADAGSSPGCPTIEIQGAGGPSAAKWEGALEITSKGARTTVSVGYVERPEGQWTGSMHYFGTFNNVGLAPWIARSNKGDVSNVYNALIQRWGALRLGNLEGWGEFLAVLTATREGSWRFANVASRCASIGGATAACYPYTNTAGVRVYVQNPVQFPIPAGANELPVAMNLKSSPTDPAVFEGRLASSLAMHYPGNPAVKLEFAASPSQLSSCFTTGSNDCLVFLKDLNAVTAGANAVVSTVGGRHLSPSGSCTQGYTAVHLPWLIPGFTLGTRSDGNGNTVRTDCRDAELPFDVSQKASNEGLNKSLAGGNPVPDGQPRRRTLRFLDGALVNQSELFLLFEESYQSFIPGQAPTTAYGYMRLKRAAANLTASDFVGLTGPATTVKTPPVELGAQCDATLVQAMGFSLASVDKGALARKLLEGSSVGAGYTPMGSTQGVHYFCEDTGTFNGGSGDDGTSGALKLACPAGSKVTYFNVCPPSGPCNRTAAQMAAETCQTTYVPADTGEACTQDDDCATTMRCKGGMCRPGCITGADCRSGSCSAEGTCQKASCGQTLVQWRQNANVMTEGGSETEPLVYRCTAPGEVYCDDDRLDLRQGKQFYRKSAGNTARSFLGIKPLVDAAFRYKTRFRSTTSGSTIGFAPARCVANSDAVPYCYSPAQIEEARQRVDCLLNLYSDTAFINSLATHPDATLGVDLHLFLKQSFSSFSPTVDGFERLYAELLIMLGDEALTGAYGSRFDLAAAGGATFRGSQFEEGGIDLTGVAGSEMYLLHQAVQYYQLALDRLYLLGPNMSIALGRGAVGTDPNFITSAMVTTYLERLVRAASQKSRAYGEITRRYQNFNRPGLARRVLERAYVETFLESALINRLMLDIADQSASTARPQILLAIEKTQRNYRMALLDMREVHQQISDETNYFGFPPDYIPFPPLDNQSTTVANAYDALSVIARQRLDLAKTREQTALSLGKQGKSDAAQFQSELTSLRNNYENQLTQICGVMQAEDGRAYPSIRKYAHTNPLATLMADPCGRTGNGDLHSAMVGVKDSSLKLRGALLRHENLFKEIDIERKRAAEQCGEYTRLATYQYTNAGTIYDMQDQMARSRALNALVTQSVQAVISSIDVLDCEIQCGSSIVMAATVAASGLAAAGNQYSAELAIAQKERALRDFERDTVRETTLSQCNSSGIDSRARIANLYNDSLESELETLRAEYAMRLAMSEVQKLTGTAQRLQALQEEAEQLAIDVQAAQNDPNVRIYQNDSVVNADISFRDALAAAYRLTRVFEYYTSQSYAKKEQLFLIRMVTAGQYNLENYLAELDNELAIFEEQFGNPDLRVMALSLRDDILQIPYLGTDRKPLGEDERIALLRRHLADPRLLDGRGYLTLPFSTALSALSPLTGVHKIRHVEVDLQGAKMGDSVARVYLRMAGTGVIRNLEGESDFFVFPSRLGVINTSILGAKIYDPEVYRNFRFRDRPLVNTLWELVINQRDEQVNKDIDLQSVTDIRVLIYYNDFTTL